MVFVVPVMIFVICMAAALSLSTYNDIKRAQRQIERYWGTEYNCLKASGVSADGHVLNVQISGGYVELRYSYLDHKRVEHISNIIITAPLNGLRFSNMQINDTIPVLFNPDQSGISFPSEAICEMTEIMTSELDEKTLHIRQLAWIPGILGIVIPLVILALSGGLQ